MTDHLWTDDEFRSFFSRLRDTIGPFSMETPNEADCDAFLRQARIRVVPEVQRRLLETIGAETAAAGIAAVAYELAGDLTYGERHVWLLVSTNPWGYFTELVTIRIRAAYKTTIGKGGKRALAGIAGASIRRELTSGDERDER